MNKKLYWAIVEDFGKKDIFFVADDKCNLEEEAKRAYKRESGLLLKNEEIIDVFTIEKQMDYNTSKIYKIVLEEVKN